MCLSVFDHASYELFFVDDLAYDLFFVELEKCSPCQLRPCLVYIRVGKEYYCIHSLFVRRLGNGVLFIVSPIAG